MVRRYRGSGRLAAGIARAYTPYGRKTNDSSLFFFAPKVRRQTNPVRPLNRRPTYTGRVDETLYVLNYVVVREQRLRQTRDGIGGIARVYPFPSIPTPTSVRDLFTTRDTPKNIHSATNVRKNDPELKNDFVLIRKSSIKI